MSGIPVSKKLWITPLSPVHMGTDEDYTPTGYVIEGNALYEFDQRALENLPKVERQALDKLLAGKASQDMLKQVQAFFHRNREWLVPAAVNVVRVSDELAALYNARIGKAANIESGGKQVVNALEIERAAYSSQSRRLMFPGSGLKGAMRTALLDAINGGKPAQHKERNRELQQRLFGGAFDKDPMRLVQVGDCAWRGPEALNSAEVLFAVNRKKSAVLKNGEEVQSQAEQRNLYQLLECATPFRFRAYQGLLNTTDLTGLNGHEEKLPRFRFSFGEIATACNRFYRPVFDGEIERLRKRGYLDSAWRDTVQHLLNNPEVKRGLETNDAFLLRVGRHSGAESVTLNGVRSIKIMKGKGENPAWKPETKTVWLATGSKGDRRYLQPFGWLLVEMTNLDEEPPRWQEAEETMAHHALSMNQWLSDVEAYRSELKERLDKIQQQEQSRQAEAKNIRQEELARQREEEERRQQEEEKRQAEEARKQAEFEALPESQQLMITFEKELEVFYTQQPLRKDNYPDFSRLVNQAVDAANSWKNTDDRTRLVELIENAFDTLGWSAPGTNSKKKKKQKEKKQNMLNELKSS